MLIFDCPIIAVNIRKYLVVHLEKLTLHEKPLALEECQNVKLLHLYNCQQGVNQLSTRCKICNHLSMKNMRVIFPVFVCICVCNCNFFGWRDEVQKKIFYEILWICQFYEFYEIFWKMGEGGNQNMKSW